MKYYVEVVYPSDSDYPFMKETYLEKYGGEREGNLELRKSSDWELSIVTDNHGYHSAYGGYYDKLDLSKFNANELSKVITGMPGYIRLSHSYYMYKRVENGTAYEQRPVYPSFVSTRRYNEWETNKDINVTPSTDDGALIIPLTGGWMVPSREDINRNILFVNIYFPRFSVDVYRPGVKYAVDINTWVGSMKFDLGSYIIDRSDAKAATTIKTFCNEEYYEYITLAIINPSSIIYGDAWKDLRQALTREKSIGGTSYEANNTGSAMCISIHPVEMTAEKERRSFYDEFTTREYVSPVDVYTEIAEYTGGQNSINITDTWCNKTNDTSDTLELRLSTNMDTIFGDDDWGQFCLTTNVTFNPVYRDLGEYLVETYGLLWMGKDKSNLQYQCVIAVQDDENVYAAQEMPYWMNGDYMFIERPKLSGQTTLSFDSFNNYREGLYLKAVLKVYLDDPDEPLLYLDSNKIPMTKELFSHFVKEDKDYGSIDSRVKLIEFIPKSVLDNMSIYNIKAYNQVVQQAIKVERPEEKHTNVIKPMFFKVRELGNMVFHPAVKEKICINLDEHKSKVQLFSLQLEGIKYKEIGRNAAGVIFDIDGSLLPKEHTTGLFYILNQDGDLVTNGKYTYEF